jgi:hypothetical protein
MKKFFVDMFSSSEGASHKRFLGGIGFLSLIIYMFAHKDIKAIEAVEYITIAYGLGTVAEKFTNKNNEI